MIEVLMTKRVPQKHYNMLVSENRLIAEMNYRNATRAFQLYIIAIQQPAFNDSCTEIVSPSYKYSF